MVQEIKDKIDIADFLRNYLSFSPAGKNLKALCPFHKEKTPSFIVSPDRQIWHCFGCSQGGDVIKFLMLYENIEFFEALKILAEKAGIDIQKSAFSDQRRFNVLYEINKAAKDFFKLQLTPEVLNYLIEERGLKKETIEEFEIGFAFGGSDQLTKYLLKSGYLIADIESAGLAFRTERGTYWDRFRGRIIFPLFNAFGKVVGFTGRIFSTQTSAEQNESAIAKYINSPETPIFNKSKLLFGFYKSKNAIREARTAVLVEGQMDFLMMWQDGIKNAIASSGTALTSEHLRILRRLAETLIISFDSDEAGQAATERAIDLAEANDFVVKIAVLKEKDPADFIKSQPGAIKSVIEKAPPAMEYYLNKYQVSKIKNQELGVTEIKKNLRIVLAKIKNIYSLIEQGQWIKELEKQTGIAESLLFGEMQNLAVNEMKEPLEKEAAVDLQLPRKELIADHLVNLAFFKKEFFDELAGEVEYLPEGHRQVLFAESKNLNDILLLRSSLSFTEKDEIKASRQFKGLLKELKLEYWKEKRQKALSLIQEAEQNNDEQKLAQELKEFDNINKEIQNLGKANYD